MSASPIVPGLLYFVHDPRKLTHTLVSASGAAAAIAKLLQAPQ